MGFNAMRMVLSTITLGICWWIETVAKSRKSTQPPTSISGDSSPQVPPLASTVPAVQMVEAAATSNLPDPRSHSSQTPSTSLLPKNLRSYIPRILLFSMFSGLLYPLAFMFGIDRTTSGNTALLLASMPMWTALLSRFVLAERLNRITWIGLGVTFLGTLLIIQAKGGVDLSSNLLLGNLFILAGAIVWASATVTSTPLLKQLSPLTLAFISAAITTPIHLAMNWHTITSAEFQWTQPSVAAAIIYSGILSTGVAYATWNIGVRKLGGSHAAVYQNVVTLVAVVISWVALGEPILAMQILGGLIAIGGLFLIRRGRTHR